MNWAEMVVLIVAIAVIGKVARAWACRPQAAADTGLRDEIAMLKEQIRRLSERTQTLERLATDKTHRLSEEIDALRN